MCDQDTRCSLGIDMGSSKMWRWYSWWLLFGTTYWTHSLMKSPSAPNTLWECLQAPKTTCGRDWSVRDPYNFNPYLTSILFDIYFMYGRLSYLSAQTSEFSAEPRNIQGLVVTTQLIMVRWGRVIFEGLVIWLPSARHVMGQLWHQWSVMDYWANTRICKIWIYSNWKGKTIRI